MIIPSLNLRLTVKAGYPHTLAEDRLVIINYPYFHAPPAQLRSAPRYRPGRLSGALIVRLIVPLMKTQAGQIMFYEQKQISTALEEAMRDELSHEMA